MMALFDSHCHVDEPRFDDDREDVLTRMAEAGVTRYAVIGSDMATSGDAPRVMELAHRYPWVYAAIGIHPHEAKGFVEDDLQRLADWSKEEKVVAIGEIGLDYYYDLSPRETQMTVCEAQMELAWELSLPVAYHIRDAHQEAPQEASDRRHHPLLFRQLGDCEGVPETGVLHQLCGACDLQESAEIAGSRGECAA